MENLWRSRRGDQSLKDYPRLGEPRRVLQHIFRCLEIGEPKKLRRREIFRLLGVLNVAEEVAHPEERREVYLQIVRELPAP